MPGPTATIDTSVLVSLQSLDLLGSLSVCFERVFVPSTVRLELREGGERNHAALTALAEYSLFEDCEEFNAELVRLLLETRVNLSQGRDEGEAEAVVQASQRGVSMVLVDDALGRKWASSHSIECHGTIWVCQELRRTGYIPELRRYFLKLIEGRRRQPLREMNSFLERFGEGAITDEESPFDSWLVLSR